MSVVAIDEPPWQPNCVSEDAHADRVKVRFRLPSEGGWPPVESEGLWAVPMGGDEYRIDNTPWFVRNLAAEDTVQALEGSDGVLWAIERTQWAGRMTIRVIPRKDGPLYGDRQAVLDAFAPFGVTGEGTAEYNMVALDIPPDTDLPSIKQLLTSGETDGRWYFEEACVNDEWQNA